MAVVERVVSVLPDVAAIDKTFDYLVPEDLAGQIRVGTMVRIQLAGRRVGGWVVADDVTPPPGINLRALGKVVGWGPSAEVIDLASWAAWRWSGRISSVLRTASPEHAVLGLPPGRDGVQARVESAIGPESPVGGAHDELIKEGFARGATGAVLRLPPSADTYPVALAASRMGNALILVPSVTGARHLGIRLRRAGVPVALLPSEWAIARAGAVVVGSRAAAWAPVKDLAAVVVIDEHDESYKEERAPTWHARDVAIERARRAGVPCVLVSPSPTLEALQWGVERVLVPARSVEREGWSIVDVIDRSVEEPGRSGLYSQRFVKALRSEGRIVCVLNRKGRSRLLACVGCGAPTRCENCDSSVAQDETGLLVCRRCGSTRPQVCQSCGKTALKNLRAGVSRAREELEALANEPVVEITGETHRGPDTAEMSASGSERRGRARIFVGTEAVLHQLDSASVVAFLDFDQELLAPRYRASEHAMNLVVRAMRLLARGATEGLDSRSAATGRGSLGRVVLQTRMPTHEVVQALLHADPSRVASAEAHRREVLGYPPVRALAVVSGQSALDFIEAFVTIVGRKGSAAGAGDPGGAGDATAPGFGIEVLGPSEGQFMILGRDHQVLCDALAATPRPKGRVRVEVDPLRV